jgi:hypothetical protein
MKTKTTTTTAANASREAARLRMTLYKGGFPGCVTVYRNGAYELLFVPHNAYTSEGTQTIRDLPKVKNDAKT